MVAEVAGLIAAFALLIIAGAVIVAAMAYAAERRSMQALMDLQFLSAMRAENEYQKALNNHEAALSEIERHAWQKGPSN